MPDSVPEFGQKEPGATYIKRPGVYAVIRDSQGRIAVVKAGRAYFLPGGGIAEGESLEQAMDREAREECGRSATILRPLGHANQHCSTRSGKHFTKLCTYVEAAFVPGSDCKPSEPDYELFWMEPPDVLRSLLLDADRWAVGRCLDK